MGKDEQTMTLSRPKVKTEDKSSFHRYLAPDSDLRFPQKINVHFPLRGQLHRLALDVNKRINDKTSTEIDFSAKSFQVPHVTIYMGFVHHIEDLQMLMEKTREFFSKRNPLKVSVTAPYLKQPRRNWVFIDLVESDDFIQLKTEFKEAVDPYMEPLSWDVVSEPPHITVGYIKSGFDAVANELEQFVIKNSFLLDAVELSFGGSRGSCLGSIRTFELSTTVK
jgi:2'-5' RNA ligase